MRGWSRTVFMTLRAGQTECQGLFDNVQWSGTKPTPWDSTAFTSTEKAEKKEGIVTDDEIESTKKALSEKLLTLMDNGVNVISKVHNTKKSMADRTYQMSRI